MGHSMAFLRITVDLTIWESIPIRDQERIVGRQKITGCPLVRINERGNNVFAEGCPIRGTSEINERGNERFRDYSQRPPDQKMNISTGPNSLVQKSHVGRLSNTPDRIFRQGYEFLEAIENYPYFRVGLNFVSFQGGTDRIYRSIKHGFSRTNFGGDSASPIPGSRELALCMMEQWDHSWTSHSARVKSFPGDIILSKQEGYPKH